MQEPKTKPTQVAVRDHLAAIEDDAPGFEHDGTRAMLSRLGRHALGKGCRYIERLSDVDAGVLEELVRWSAAELRRRDPIA